MPELSCTWDASHGILGYKWAGFLEVVDRLLVVLLGYSRGSRWIAWGYQHVGVSAPGAVSPVWVHGVNASFEEETLHPTTGNQHASWTVQRRNRSAGHVKK